MSGVHVCVLTCNVGTFAGRAHQYVSYTYVVYSRSTDTMSACTHIHAHARLLLKSSEPAWLSRPPWILSPLYCIPRILLCIYSLRFTLSFPFHYCRAYLYTRVFVYLYHMISTCTKCIRYRHRHLPPPPFPPSMSSCPPHKHMYM